VGTLTEGILAALAEEHITVQSNTAEAKDSKEENTKSFEESLIPARTREAVMSGEQRTRQQVINLGLLDANAEESEMDLSVSSSAARRRDRAKKAHMSG